MMLVISVIVPYIPAQAATTSITVAEAIANNSGSATVEGYIVGAAISGSNYDQEPPFTISTNIGIADSPDETDASKILPVQLPTGAVRAGLNLVDNPNLFKTKVQITGSLSAYFSVPGLRSASAYTLVEEGEDKVVLAEDLFFSEYIEGGSNNKALEIFNGTGAAVNLDGYVVELYSNGGTTVQNSETLSGTIENGDVFVLYNSGSVDAVKAVGDIASTTTFFNGDDTVLLKKDGVVIDSIGQLGFRPSGSWTVDGVSTLDQTLVRKATITTGDADPTDVFNPSLEWDSYPRDTFTYLGSHTMEGGTTPPPPVETKVANVTATPTAGNVVAGTTVALSTATADATIYYTTDGSTPTTASTLYTMPIEINENTTIQAIAVKNGLEKSDVQTFTYEVLSAMTVADVRAAAQGSAVVVEAIVTTDIAKFGNNGFYIQDDTAGIYVFTSADTGVKEGDRVSIQGKLGIYQGDIQITNPVVAKLTANNPLPAVQVVPASSINNDTLGERLLVEEATISNIRDAGFGTIEFTATTEDGSSVLVRNDNRNGYTYEDFIKQYKNGDVLNIYGFAGIFNGTFQLKTIGAESFELSVKPAVFTNIFPGSVSEGTQIELLTEWDNATIYYTLDGSTPTTASTVYTAPIELTATTTIRAIAVTANATSDVFSFKYTVLKTENVTIEEIQGEDHYSPYTGAQVTGVTGVITHFYNTANFFIQTLSPDNNPATAEGIAVNLTSAASSYSVGDVVTVSGIVQEHFYEGYSDNRQTDLPITRIGNSTVAKSGMAALPDPVRIGVDRDIPTSIIDNDELTSFDPQEDGIDFWESLEGMRVSVPNAQVVGPQKYGEVIVVNTEATNNEFNILGGINISADDYNPERVIFDIDNESYVAKSGDRFAEAPVGVVGYGFGNYKVFTSAGQLPELIEVDHPSEVTTIEQAEEKLTVATYNIENFSANVSETSNAKAARIAESFVVDMKSPDIIGLVEVQDNDGSTPSNNSDASQSYERLIAAIKAAGGPTYSYTDIAPVYNQDGGQPGGNIRVGYLYNAERVDLVAGTKGGSTEAVQWTEDGSLTLNPGRILDLPQPNTRKPLAAEFMFNGEKVVVITAHLNSKSGDQGLFGKNQPPVLGSEEERIQLAAMINSFIQRGLEKDPNLNVVVAGDMNDFEFTPTLTALKGDILVNMIEQVPVEDRFTYYYQGNNQVLDHILVTKNLLANTVVDILHINANKMEEHGRASDHDPILIQIDFTKEVVPPIPPLTYDRYVEYSNTKTGKIVIATPKTHLTVGDNVRINNGIEIKSQVAGITGSGLADRTVLLNPNKPNAQYDFEGTVVKEVVISGKQQTEIRNAENVGKFTYAKGASEKQVTFLTTSPTVEQPETPDEPVDPETPEEPTEPEEPTNPEEPGTPSGDYNTANGYYSGLEGLEGDALKAALHNIIDEQIVLSYNQVWTALKYTDEDPNNTNNVKLFYSGISRSKDLNGGNVGNWNREHVWAQSHGNFGTSNGPGTDIHHLRATDVQVNSSRGNLDFDWGGSSVVNCPDCKRDSDSFEPPTSVKGDVARMLFYMATRYEAEDGVDLELNEKVNNGTAPYHGKLSVLLEWHKLDPVDATEIERNNRIYEAQENRNPFIDNPQWAEMIWN
ncbi:endonuclease [Chryseomicrobium palamuruense]|uniref:Endonuclease n=1 Tax=Chryseomicrobium palamuruense TaxID=682973 RepID=A0ABV8USA9_9BACL